jgi:hypothetical protein
MGEIGCLKDGNFQNLQAANIDEINNVSGKQTSNGVVHGFIKGSAAVTATAAANTDITLGVFPANCRIKNLMITFNSVITTAGASGDDLDFSLGVAGDEDQIIIPTAIADDGGAAVTIEADVTYFLIQDFRCTAANVLDATGSTAANGTVEDAPATNEAIVVVSAAAHIKTTDRTLVARLTPLANDLAATGTCTVVLEYISSFTA